MFPVGLMMIVVTGAELFTGNCMYLVASCLAGLSTWRQLVKSWVLSYIFNFIGCLAMAYFGTYLAGMLDADPWHTYILKLGWNKSTQHGWGEILLRGIAANWLVCLALFMGIASDTFEGKVFGLWWPVFTFVAIGYEHSIANMYFISTSLMYTSTASSASYHFTIGDFIARNLIPSTLGNIIGGGFFTGAVYHFVYRHQTIAGIKHLRMSQGSSAIHPQPPSQEDQEMSPVGRGLPVVLSHASLAGAQQQRDIQQYEL
jgi:formate/nitrite transporter